MSSTPLVRNAPAAAARLLLALAAWPIVSSAQAERLDTVVVTGTREPTPLDRVVADVVVIDAQRIRDSNADSIEDLLRREGGIQMSRNGGPGQSAGVLLRGTSASHTLVLVDGVRIGSATLGQADLSGISLAQVERIEVLRGPGSSLYGADAVGGVVNIITRHGKAEPQLAAHLAAGSYGSSEADAAVSGASQSIDYAASVSREASDGVSAVKPGDSFGLFNPDRDGFQRRSAQLRAGFTFAPGHRIGASVLDSRLRSQYDSAEYNPPTFAPDPSPDFRIRFDTRVGALDYRGTLSPQWTTSVQLSEQRDDLVSGGTTTSRYLTERKQVTWQNAWTPTASQQLVAALDHVDETVTAPFAAPDRRNDAAVLGYTAQFGAHKLQVDVREDHNSIYGNVGTGKLGWRMDLQQGLSVRVVAGTAFRAPTFNDLYFPGYGVSTVRPEHSRSVEAGLSWESAATSAQATLYRNDLRDMIGYQADPSLCPADPQYAFGCAGNVSRARLQGATLTASHRMGAIGVHGTIDVLDAKDRSTGQRLARRAAHQETVGADWTSGPWTLDASVLDVGARPEGGAQLAAYQTLDLQARYRLTPQWRAEAKLLNATDRHYEPAHDYQSLGRQAWLGVRYNGAGL
jgi:vitamin B12 transporter